MNPADLELGEVVQLVQSGRVPEAIDRLRRGVQTYPSDFRFHMVLGDLCQIASQLPEALAAFDRAVALNPDEPWLHAKRATVLRDLKRLDEAAAAAAKAVDLQPDDFQNHLCLAQVLHAAKNHVDAAEAALTALRLNPDSTEAANVATVALMASGLADQACEVGLDFAKSHPAELSIALAVSGRMTYAEGFTPIQRRVYAIEMARRVQAQLPSAPQPPIRDPRPERQLRIGYLSQDINRRSSITYFIERVFQHHDRDRYPITCYLTQPSMGPMSDRMKSHLTRWVDVEKMSDADLAERIRRDKIDILVDLAGRTPGHRIPALLLGPAPIVMNAIGDPLTTGLSCINYRLTDAIADPPECDAHWVEKLIRLPECFLCYEPPDDAPPSRTPRAPDSKDSIVFGSLNILAKTGPGVLALWAKVLHAVPGAKLLLKCPPMSHPRMRSDIEDRFATHGITKDRLILRGHSPDLPEHLRTYEEVDIALDPLPYNGTTTSCEALWMGVPMLALAGDGHASRVGASLLTAIGLQDLIAKDESDFVRIAANLAADPRCLSELHAALRDRMARSMLCDGPAHARAIESAFRQVWRERCASR